MSKGHRKIEVLKYINLNGTVGLEIGPGCSPLVLPQEANIRYCDHLDQVGLIKKYENDPAIRPDQIPLIHYVWGEKGLVELVGKQEVDYVIASHVIEHVPNIVTWLDEIQNILKPEGILSLVVPDKRYTFDYGRQTSRFSDVLAAYIEKRRQPSNSQIIDHLSQVVTMEGRSAWSSQIPLGRFSRSFSDQEAHEIAQSAFESNKYTDVHCWVFTQESLLRILYRLNKLNLFHFEVLRVTPTNSFDCEFYMSLRVCPGGDVESILRREKSLVNALKSVTQNMKLQFIFESQDENYLGTYQRSILSQVRRLWNLVMRKLSAVWHKA